MGMHLFFDRSLKEASKCMKVPKKTERKQGASIGFFLDNPQLDSKIRFDFFINSDYRLNKKKRREGAFLNKLIHRTIITVREQRRC